MTLNQRIILLALATVVFAGLPAVGFADAPRHSARELSKLPPNHRIVHVRDRDYYYHGGKFYRPSGGVYVVVNAPIGARVKSLPSGYITFGIGSRRYYRVNATYYLWDGPTREYVVVEKPANADEAIDQNTEVTSSANIFVYPRQGQSEAQRDQDRYECHRWAKDQTGFDPSLPEQDATLSSDYNRAISACLEGRGYTVR